MTYSIQLGSTRYSWLYRVVLGIGAPLGSSHRDMVGITVKLLQHGFKSRKTSSLGIKKGSPIDKKIILAKKHSSCSISRKTETFCKSLDENNTGSHTFGHSKMMQNFITFKTFTVKNSFPTNNESRRCMVGETEVKEMLKRGTIRKVQPLKGQFVSKLFPVKKKDGSQRPVINLKQLNAYIPYCYFKLEVLQNLKYMLQKGDYMYKLDLKVAYFSVLLERNSR